MKFIQKNLFQIFLIAFLVILPVISFANTPARPPVLTTPADPCAGKICNPLGSRGINNIPEFIKTLLTGVLRVGIPIVALAIIYCGFLFVQAQGNSEKIGEAKDALLYTIIGAAILLGSWAIAGIISNTVLVL